MWPSWSATPPAIQGRPFLAPIPTSGGPNEWWTDLAGLRHALVGQREAGVKFIPGDPVAYQQGEVGWAIDHRMRFRVGELASRTKTQSALSYRPNPSFPDRRKQPFRGQAAIIRKSDWA
jgi:hypothetical protein